MAGSGTWGTWSCDGLPEPAKPWPWWQVDEAPPSTDDALPTTDAMATAVARAIVAAAVFIEHDSDTASNMTRAAMAKLTAACEAVAPGEIERMRKVVSK